MENKWRLTNGESLIMEGDKEICKIIYPINSEEDFETLEYIENLILEAPEMKELLKDILNHINSNLINLEGSTYLKNDIEKILNKIPN